MIYKNVQRLCKENGTNIFNLEKACGIANGTVGKWENRVSSPRVDTLQKVADFFGVSVAELLSEEK